MLNSGCPAPVKAHSHTTIYLCHMQTPPWLGLPTTSQSAIFISQDLPSRCRPPSEWSASPRLSKSNLTPRAGPGAWLYSEAFTVASVDPVFHFPVNPSAPKTWTVTRHFISSSCVYFAFLSQCANPGLTKLQALGSPSKFPGYF